MPRDFTTGRVAELCGVAPRTAAKWIDTGLLRGYTLPGTHHRRVTRDDLQAFARANKIPIELPAEQDGAASE